MADGEIKGKKEMQEFLRRTAERFAERYDGLLVFPETIDHAYEIREHPGQLSVWVPGKEVPEPFLAALAQTLWESAWGNSCTEALDSIRRELDAHLEGIQICIEVVQDMFEEAKTLGS
jgi:hypothetical protein